MDNFINKVKTWFKPSRLSHLLIGLTVGALVYGAFSVSAILGVGIVAVYGQYMRDKMSEEIKYRDKNPEATINQASIKTLNPFSWTKHNRLDTLVQVGAVTVLGLVAYFV